MTKKDCSAGSHWNNVVSDCVPVSMDTKAGPPTEPPLAVVVQLRSTARTDPVGPVGPVAMLCPILVIFVAVVILGSILALALWFIICRRQTRLRGFSEVSGPQQEPFGKTEAAATIHSLPSEGNSHAAVVHTAGGAPSPCSPQHLRAPNGSQPEDGFTTHTETAKHAGTQDCRRMLALSMMREHRVPLPATELGGTALVTTKTM